MASPDPRILILDDDLDVACAAQLLLRRRFLDVRMLQDPAQLSDFLTTFVPELCGAGWPW